jgi:hypothetical protein
MPKRVLKVRGYELVINGDGSATLDGVKFPSEAVARRHAQLWRAGERAEARAESRASAKFERWAHG